MSSGDEASTAHAATAPKWEARNRRCTLVVVEGPDAGKTATLDESMPARILAGTSPICTLVLSDPLVSRRHAAFDFTEHGLKVVDLDSTNGTLVSGLRIESAYLRGGETIELGASKVRLDWTADASENAVPESMRFGRVIGASWEMRRLYPLCEKLARANVPLIIEGETGTGKEVLAEALHEASPRQANPFVVFDCTAIPPTLAESILFGHEKGAFTGATSARRGVFEQADQGTLFIDEIGDLDPVLQPKLLRAIQRSEVQRVGAERWIKVDVRVIAATRRNLDHEVQSERFRDDLYFRLAVARIELPPLRQRRGDVSVLARHFWRELEGEGSPPADLLARLESHEWPGNVRELYNAVARRIALGELDAPATMSQSIPPPSTSSAPADVLERVLGEDLPFARAREKLLEEFERRYVARVLEKYRGNVGRAAAASGIKRRYFQVLRARSQNKE